MTSLSAYAVAPVAAVGLRTILEQQDSYQVCGVFSSLEKLECHLRTAPPDLLLLELSAELNLNHLKRIASINPRTAIILWFDIVSVEYLAQALALGAQGILNKNSSVEVHLQCLKAVAQGYSWIDEEAGLKLATTSRVALAPRERHVTGLVAQGLSNKQIAWSLGITEGTVKVYLSKLFEKVGVNDRLELALLALKNLSANQTAAASMPRAFDGDKVKPLSMPAFLSL